MGRETCFPVKQYLCHNAKVVHVFEAQVLRKSPGSEIEIARDTQFSIAHAAPPYVSLPAVSSIGGLRTPALVHAAPPSWGRHPQTFTHPDMISHGGSLTALGSVGAKHHLSSLGSRNREA